MKVYCTSKNSGPESGTIHMVYLGTSVDKATEAVGNFVKYRTDTSLFPKEFLHSYTALPRDIKFTLLQYYPADGWWYSVVLFDLHETLIGRDYLTKPLSELNSHPQFSGHARRVVLAMSGMHTEQLKTSILRK